MKALVVTAPETFGWVDLPDPQPLPNEALVQIHVCGVCGSTDRELVAGTQPYRPPYPFVLGHEAVGTVVAVGAEVRDYRVGDRVTRPTCRSLQRPPEGLNSGWGGFAELGLVQDGDSDYTAARQCQVPRDLDPSWAFLAISLAETRAFLDQVAELSEPLAGKAVVVVGTGIAGLTLTYFARLAGASPVITLGRRPARLDLARRGGADAALDSRDPGLAEAVAELTGGRGAQVLFEAIGKPAVLASLAGLLAPGATVGIYGAADAAEYAAATAQLPADARVFRPGPEEQRYVSQMGEAIAAGDVPVDLWRTHVWSTADMAQAFAQVDRGEVVKGCVQFE